MKTRIFLNIIIWMFIPVIALMADDEVLDHLTVPFSNPGKPGYVEVELLKGSVTIIGYEGAEVDITSKTAIKKFSEDEQKRQGTDGMFHIPVTFSEMEVTEDNNHVQIDIQSMRNSVDLEIKVPMNTSLTVQTVHDGDIVIQNINGEIEAENVHGSITITNVSGSVAASTTHGDVKVSMNRVNPEKPMAFNTFHGDVDVTLPATLKATVKIKTTNGDVYSDFNITKTENPNLITQEKTKRKEGKYRVVIEHGFYGTIASGGPEFSFNTYHGDILIHKAK